MTYAAELDDCRQEVRRGYAGNLIYFWPKIAGTGNVLAATSPAPTYSIIDPQASVLGSGLSPTATTIDGVTRFSFAIDATNTQRYLLFENYAVVLTWTFGGIERVNTIRFDCVLEPYDGSDVSINDLVDEVADIRELLDRQAAAQATARTAEQQAALLGMKAWADVKQWIKSMLEAKGRIYPRLLLQRDELRSVVAAQAVARAYRAQGGGSDSAARALYQDWTEEADRRLKSLGPLDYDLIEDRIADIEISGFGVLKLGRSWT